MEVFTNLKTNFYEKVQNSKGNLKKGYQKIYNSVKIICNFNTIKLNNQKIVVEEFRQKIELNARRAILKCKLAETQDGYKSSVEEEDTTSSSTTDYPTEPLTDVTDDLDYATGFQGDIDYPTGFQGTID